MNVQEYIPTPVPPAPEGTFADWTDPFLGFPILAILVLLAAIVLVVAIAIAASYNRPRPPIETTP